MPGCSQACPEQLLPSPLLSSLPRHNAFYTFTSQAQPLSFLKGFLGRVFLKPSRKAELAECVPEHTPGVSNKQRTWRLHPGEKNALQQPSELVLPGAAMAFNLERLGLV